jgi:uncharacterized protein YkwD
VHAALAAAGAAFATVLASASVFAASYTAAPVNLGHLYAPPAPTGCLGTAWYCQPGGGLAPTQPQGSQGTQGSQGSQGSAGSAGAQGSPGAGTGTGAQGGAGTSAGAGGGAATGSTSGLTAGESEMLSLINRARVAAGLGTLTINPTLERLANERAAVMAANNAITHDVPGYGMPAQMEAAAGYVAQASGAEDIAEAGSVLQAFAMFRGSPVHWSNIIYPSFTQVGIAVVQASYGQIVDVLFSGNPA